MTEEEILYQMACDFGHEAYSELGEMDYELYEYIEGKDIAKYFAKKLAARDVEMQKQIEAVRGLILEQTKMVSIIRDYPDDYPREDLLQEINSGLCDSIDTLTETLKPYLGDDKLEV